MKINKIFGLIFAGSLLLTPVFADDFDDFDSDFGNEFESESSDSAAGFSIGGEAKIAPRLYVADENESSFSDKTVTVVPEVKLNLGYETSNAEFKGTLAFNNQILSGYYEDILNEFTARVYLGDWTIEGGKEKIVWGKGDKLHVLDNFNANDYTDYIVPEYIDRRLAEPLIKIAYNSPSSSNFHVEAIWAPVMTPDRLGKGRWLPGASENLKSSLTQAGTLIAAGMKSQLQTAFDNHLISETDLSYKLTSILSNASKVSDNIYPDTRSIKYSQAGIRMTGTLGSFDIGGSYYYGHYKTPSVDASKIQSFITKYLSDGKVSEDDYFLNYDQVHIFGLEAGGVIGALNTRAEFAYNMTNDFAGDDAAIKNHSINWLAGFDIDIPLHNININIQNIGKYILNNGDIDKNTNDTEYDKDGIYSNNKIVLNISDSYNYEKIKPSVTILYGVERCDLVIQPKITYAVKPGFELSAQGMILVNFGDKDKSEFESWIKKNNSFVQLGLKYSF